jgi:glycosyltransferase involved in cell wall biosynthesis
VVAGLREVLPEAEILVVDDGSTDATAAAAASRGARVLSQPYRKGNGAAVKTGAAHARGEVLALMDADGQHDPASLPPLLAKLAEGYDMVVGARDRAAQASLGRQLANALYNRAASWMVEQPIQDLTSGLRVARTAKFREFLPLLPNGFSYPTTITMAFYRSGYSVGFVPARVGRRVGRSHIRPLHDGFRFLLIMFRICTLYSPLRLFLPVSLAFLALAVGYYAYTYTTAGRFTNMSALLASVAVLVFLIGLVSEQITMLIFQGTGRR